MTEITRRTMVTMTGLAAAGGLAACASGSVSTAAAQATMQPGGTIDGVRPGRVRHYVIAAKDPEVVAGELHEFLQLKPRPEKPKPAGSGTEAFGFRTRMMRVGTTMLEIVTPIREPHLLHTFFAENGGDGGFMVVMQTYDDKAMLERTAQNGLKLAMEMPNFAGQHLMQFDYQVFGTRFEFYRYTPEDGWWGNPNDTEWPDPQAVSDIVGAAVAVNKPAETADLAARTFIGARKGNSVLFSIDRKIDFVPTGAGKPGLRTIYLTARDRKRVGTAKTIGGLELRFV